ncbi:MAG: ABC transporter permease [Deltaproteobacteria bacterium]|nr:ABC transporter permease [Deltaproteobacteria bacterium]
MPEPTQTPTPTPTPTQTQTPTPTPTPTPTQPPTPTPTPTLRQTLFAPARAPLWSAIFAIASALLVCFLAILATGKDPVAGYGWLLQGAFGGLSPLGETSIKTAVLTLTGLSVAIAFCVGLFNIGAEGQLIWGALAAAVCGRALDAPAFIAIPAALLCAGLAGGLWALLPALLKTYRGVHEVISTILLNWVAIHLVHGWLVTGPLAAHSSGSDISVAGTEPIRVAAQLPRLFMQGRTDLGIVISLALAACVWVVPARPRRGFEWRAVGAGPDAAYTAGISNTRSICEAMLLAGALAGIAGGLLILGTEHRYPGVFRTGYGFDGIAVALVGGGTAPGAVLAGLFFGALRAGATRLQLVGIHPSFAELIQGLAVLFVAAPRIFAPIVTRLRGRAPEEVA